MKKTRSQSILRSLLMIFLDPFIQSYSQNFHQYLDSKVGFGEVVISSQSWIKMFLGIFMYGIRHCVENSKWFCKKYKWGKKLFKWGKKLVIECRPIVNSIWSSNPSIYIEIDDIDLGRKGGRFEKFFTPLPFEKFFTPYMGVKTFQNLIQSNVCKIRMNISKSRVSMKIQNRTLFHRFGILSYEVPWPCV